MNYMISTISLAVQLACFLIKYLIFATAAGMSNMLLRKSKFMAVWMRNTPHSPQVMALFGYRGCGGLCAHRKPLGNQEHQTHRVVSSMGEMLTCFPSRRLRADLVNTLVTLSLSVWLRPHHIFPQILIISLFFSLKLYNLYLWKMSDVQSIEPICHTYVMKFQCSHVLNFLVHTGLR